MSNLSKTWLTQQPKWVTKTKCDSPWHWVIGWQTIKKHQKHHGKNHSHNHKSRGVPFMDHAGAPRNPWGAPPGHPAISLTTGHSCFKSQCCHLLYNHAKADFQLFWDTLSHVPWDSVIDYNSDIDCVWTQWRDLFLSVADSCILRVRWRRRKIKCWFTDHTLRLIRQKRRVYRSLRFSPNDTLRNKYSRLSNLVRASTIKERHSGLCSDYLQILFHCT